MKKLMLAAMMALACATVWSEEVPEPCGTLKKQGEKTTEVSPVQSCDPNEISGPLGTGEGRYVLQGEWMNYTIYFENKTNATAAAQEITVTLPMDPGLDWSTLELGEIAFGEHIDMGLNGKRHGNTSYALPGTNTSVKTEVSAVGTNLVWYLRIYDPTTLDNFPDDPRGGFLPPNDPETHCGEGHLSYRVKVADATPNGTVIRASADIQFDTNEHIETDPSWWNTVGEIKSISLPLGDETTTNLTLVVGQPFGELPVPSARTGHDFAGWYLAEKGDDEPVKAETIVPAELETLYPRWTPQQFAVDVDGVVSQHAYGTTVDLTTPASATNGCTNVVCVGWVGTGDVPAAGTGNAVTFTVTQESALRWLYETNYWVSTTAVGPRGAQTLPAGGRVTLKDAAGVALPTNELWAAAGTNLTAEATADEGSAFARWVDVETGAELGLRGALTLPVNRPWIVRAEFTNLMFAVRFELGEHGSRTGGGALAQTVAWGEAAIAPIVEVEKGYAFAGWSTAFDCVTQDLVVTAQYEEVDVTPTLVSETETYVDVALGEVAPYKTAATVYDGYLYEGDGVVKGTIQVKVAKGKVDKKTGAFTAKVTATVQLADGSKKVSFKNGIADAAGNVTGLTAAGHTLDVSLGVNGMGGTMDGMSVDGARNVFSAKDADSKALAKEIESMWVGAINVVGDGIVLSVTVAKKGKVKVSGTVDGAKVSATSQLLVGAEACCIPVVIAKKAKLAFNLWLMGDGSVELVGLDGATAGKAGTLKSGAAFRMDGAALAETLPGLLTDYLPDGLAVGLNKTKWIVAPDEKGKAAKAGKVAINKKTGEIDEMKLGVNPSALKLTYTAKSGSFKGSFKAYTLDAKGKIKSYTVNVTGVMVGDVGYGTATLKKPAYTLVVAIE